MAVWKYEISLLALKKCFTSERSKRVKYLIFIFIFNCQTIITKNIGKEEKKKWRGDLTETIGAYERLGLLDQRDRAV